MSSAICVGIWRATKDLFTPVQPEKKKNNLGNGCSLNALSSLRGRHCNQKKSTHLCILFHWNVGKSVPICWCVCVLCMCRADCLVDWNGVKWFICSNRIFDCRAQIFQNDINCILNRTDLNSIFYIQFLFASKNTQFRLSGSVQSMISIFIDSRNQCKAKKKERLLRQTTIIIIYRHQSCIRHSNRYECVERWVLHDFQFTNRFLQVSQARNATWFLRSNEIDIKTKVNCFHGFFLVNLYSF